MRYNEAERIRTSYEHAARHAPRLHAALYARLETLGIARGLGLVPDSAPSEGRLLAALATVALNVRHLDVLDEALMQLGAEQFGHSVLPEHVPVIRDALIEALRSVSADAWNDAVERDWYVALSLVGESMLRGLLRKFDHAASTRSRH